MPVKIKSSTLSEMHANWCKPLFIINITNNYEIIYILNVYTGLTVVFVLAYNNAALFYKGSH